MAEVSQQRQAYAKTLGATDVLDPTVEDVVGRVRAMTDDAGADVGFECSGVQAGLDAAVGGIRTRGTVTIVSLWETKPAIDAFEVVSSEKHVLGAVVCEEGDFEAVIEAIWQGMFVTWPVGLVDCLLTGCDRTTRSEGNDYE